MTTQQLTAFWRYDRFPFVLHGTIEEVRDDGSVRIKEYGGSCFMPIAILPTAAAEAVVERLKALRATHEHEVKRISREFYAEAEKAAPFMKAVIKEATGS